MEKTTSPSPAGQAEPPKPLVTAELEVMSHEDWLVKFTLAGRDFRPWCYPLPEEHASFIVRAVNFLETSLQAIEKAQGVLENFVHPEAR